jgi:uncharacterized protein (DUF924 family)
MRIDLYIPPKAQELLDHWFGDGLSRGWPSESRQALWFGFNPEQDEDLRRRFGPLVDEAIDGGLGEWAESMPSLLALVLLLDQLSRNLFRRQARAFAGDARAEALVQAALAAGADKHLPLIGRVFFYMPLMHSESLASQEQCVRLFEALLEEAPPEHREAIADNLRFAQEHRDTVARFGRFPHRNAVLGRENTAEETEFLRDGPRYGQ